MDAQPHVDARADMDANAVRDPQSNVDARANLDSHPCFARRGDRGQRAAAFSANRDSYPAPPA